jgi:hypothetical protein
MKDPPAHREQFRESPLSHEGFGRVTEPSAERPVHSENRAVVGRLQETASSRIEKR